MHQQASTENTTSQFLHSTEPVPDIGHHDQYTTGADLKSSGSSLATHDAPSTPSIEALNRASAGPPRSHRVPNDVHDTLYDGHVAPCRSPSQKRRSIFLQPVLECLSGEIMQKNQTRHVSSTSPTDLLLIYPSSPHVFHVT